MLQHTGSEFMPRSEAKEFYVDLQMPEETGTGFYRKLRHKKELEDIPVIVLSGLSGRDVAVSKSVVIIDKPPKEEAILEEVKKAVGE